MAKRGQNPDREGNVFRLPLQPQIGFFAQLYVKHRYSSGQHFNQTRSTMPIKIARALRRHPQPLF
jgi:hypothetical protein